MELPQAGEVWMCHHQGYRARITGTDATSIRGTLIEAAAGTNHGIWTWRLPAINGRYRLGDRDDNLDLKQKIWSPNG